MGLNIGAVLAALGGGATAAGTAMDENTQRAEEQRRRQILEALQMLEVKDKYGLTEIPDEQSSPMALQEKAMTQLSQTKPNVQAAGGMGMPAYKSGPSYTEQRDAQIGSPQARQKPDIVSIGPRRFVRDPSQSAKVRDARQALVDAEAKGGAEIKGKFNAVKALVPGEAPGRTAERVGLWPRGEGDTPESRLQRATMSAAQKQAQFEAANTLKLKMQKAALDNARITAGMRAGRADHFQITEQVKITQALMRDVATQDGALQRLLADPFATPEQKDLYTQQRAELQQQRAELTAQFGELQEAVKGTPTAAPTASPASKPSAAPAAPSTAPTAGPTKSRSQWRAEWAATNPKGEAETPEAYAARIGAAARAAGYPK